MSDGKVHARLSPSSAHSWAVCTGRLDFVERNKEKLRKLGRIDAPDSEASKNGTLCHSLGEAIILANAHPTASIRAQASERAVMLRLQLPEEMIQNAEAYATWGIGFVNMAGDIPWGVELSAPLWYEPDRSGTTDFWAIENGDTLVVVDYKSGRVPVDVEGNLQLLIYAIALYEMLRVFNPSIRKFRLGVMQPFIHGPHEPKWWDVTEAMLERAKDAIDAAVFEVDNPFGGIHRLVPSPEGCRFCPARPLCPALAAPVEEFAALASEPVDALTNDQLVEIMKKAKPVKDFLDAVKEAMLDLPPDWLSDRGITLAAGANRVWPESEETEKKIDEALAKAGGTLYKQVPKTVAQIEREGLLEAVEWAVESRPRTPTVRVKKETRGFRPKR